MNIFSFLILSLIALSSPFILPQAAIANRTLTTTEMNHERAGAISIAAIIDQTSRPGKEAKVAIKMAIHDFSTVTNQSILLYFQNSKSKPVRAALAAKDLIDTHGVKAIVGAHTWEEASAIAEAASEAGHDAPVFLSLADTTPPWATDSFLVQASPSQHVQMNAIAAIVKSWGFRKVTLIYENLHSLSIPSLFVSQLSQAFQQTGGELTNIIPIASFSFNSFDKQLKELKKKKCRVFIIHTSLESGFWLYQTAKKLEMTGDGYAWITTNRISDLFHSISPTKMYSMQGLIALKTYFPENSPEFQDFRKNFRAKFRTEYPDEENDEPGIFAAQAYDTMRAIFDNNKCDTDELLERISAANFCGLSGKIQYTDRTIAPANTVEIVNVIGKSYQSGYWTKGLGFSENVDNGAIYDNSMEMLGKVLWPAQPSYTERRRRILAEREEPLRVGVPTTSLFSQFVKVENDPKSNKTTYDGFSIKVFEETMKRLPEGNTLSYEYFPFDIPYNELVEQISLGKIDAVAGDVTIISERHELADFTQPYTESGMELIVPVRSRLPNRVWLFMKPFTKEMWGLIAAITVYNGFIVWLIERKHSEQLRGSIPNQVGTIFWLSFATLFTLQGEKLHSNLSRMAMVVWLFVALIITQSYTASLASMLTAQRLEPAIKDVETLKKMNATVGYCKGSFLHSYLKDVLHFESFKIKNYSSTAQYAKALNTGEIAAIFLEVPSAKVFLAQYCKSFTKTKETFKFGGFGFAFQKNFSMLPDINQALMNVTESGKLRELENTYIVSEKCVDLNSISSNEDASIDLSSFWVLFGLTGGTSTVALAAYAISFIKKFQKSMPQNQNVFEFISVVSKQWQQQRRQSSSIVSNAESPRNTVPQV